jgi:hypothetical protein
MKQGKTEDRCRCASRPMMMMMNRTDHENLGEFLISAKIVPKDISTLSLTHGVMTPPRDALLGVQTDLASPNVRHL